MHRFRTIAVTAVAGIALAACGQAASSSADTSSAASAGGVLPSFTAGAVADLEALIPDAVGDLTMQKVSTQGSEFLVAPGSNPAFIQLVEDLGVSPSDISIASGFGVPMNASSPPASLIMFVFQASGADTSRLISGFKAALDAQRDTPLTWSSDEIGGNPVEKALDGGSTVYLYAKSDVLVFVFGDADSAEEAISGLP